MRMGFEESTADGYEGGLAMIWSETKAGDER